MPAPRTIADQLAAVRLSRLVGPRDLADAVGALADPTPAGLLAALVASGGLTRFQAAELARGRWDGFHVGPYCVLDLLGEGGMGRVYLARHADTGECAAVKVLPGRLAADPVARARFLREALTAASIDHPHVVRLVDADATARRPYLAMEYVPGVTLQAAVARRGAVPPGLAADLARQVALGLQAAHERGLVHRDVKPANVVVGPTGHARLLDLGAVKTTGDSSGLTTTRAGRVVLGTADYLAPEQALNSSAVDTRADLYALGATLYFLLAGRPPYPSGEPCEVLRAKLAADPPPLRTARPDCPPALAHVVDKLLARRPRDRFQTPQAAALALTAYARPDPDHLRRVFAADTLADSRVHATGLPTDAHPAAPARSALTGPMTGMPTEVLPAPAPPGPVARLIGRVVGLWAKP